MERKKPTTTKVCNGAYNEKDYKIYLAQNELKDTFKNTIRFLITRASDSDEFSKLMQIYDNCDDDNCDVAYTFETDKDSYTICSFLKKEEKKMKEEFIADRVNSMSDKEYTGALLMIKGIAMFLECKDNIEITNEDDALEFKKIFIESLNHVGIEFGTNLGLFYAYIASCFEFYKLMNSINTNEKEDKE